MKLFNRSSKGSKRIQTKEGIKFGTRVSGKYTGVEFVVESISFNVAGCEVIAGTYKTEADIDREVVSNSNSVSIINTKNCSTYAEIFNKVFYEHDIRVGHMVRDEIAKVEGIVVEMQYHVNSDANILIAIPHKPGSSRYASGRLSSATKISDGIIDEITKSRIAREKDELEIELGDDVKCMATGLKGNVSAILQQRDGTISVAVQPPMHNGELQEAVFIDVELLRPHSFTAEEKPPTPPKEEIKKRKSGCVRSAEITAAQGLVR